MTRGSGTTGALVSGSKRLALVCLLPLVTACGDSAGRGGHAFDTPAPDGSRLPHLTLDIQARPVLSWVEDRGDGHALVFAVLGEDGWKEPVVVASGDGWFVNWADVPSVQPLGDHLWAAHWLVEQPGGMYAYDIAIAMSQDGGASWAPPFRPHDDGTPTEHGFVSLWPVRRPDGTAALGAAWLDGRHNLVDPTRAEAGDARTMLRSAVFEASGTAVATAQVDERVCDCCQTDVALTPNGALLAYRDRSAGEIRDVAVAASTADGWEVLGAVAEDGWRITGCPVNGPAITARNDEIAVAWYTEAAGQRVQLARRHADDPHWSRPAVLDATAPLGRVDVALLEDGDAVVSWLAATREGSDGTAEILIARVGRDGAVAEPLRIAATEASRPAGFPRMIRDGGALLLAWTHWQDGIPQVVTARVEPDEVPRPGA